MISFQLRSHNKALQNCFTSPHVFNRESKSSVIVSKGLVAVHPLTCLMKEAKLSLTSSHFICSVWLSALSLSALYLQPLAQWWRLMPKDAAKMPESAWKLVFYTMSWSYSTYLLFFTSYSFFQDPPSVFYSKIHNSVKDIMQCTRPLWCLLTWISKRTFNGLNKVLY